MNKADIVNAIAKETEMSKADSERALTATLDAIKDALVAGDSVMLIGFGTFKVSDRAARTGRNPQTGEEIDIPATKVPSFKAGKALKDAVNEAQ